MDQPSSGDRGSRSQPLLISLCTVLDASGEDIPENVRELMLRNTQYGGSDAETPTRRALQRFEVLCLSHGRLADLSQLAEMGALVEVNLNFNGVSSLAGLRECR